MKINILFSTTLVSASVLLSGCLGGGTSAIAMAGGQAVASQAAEGAINNAHYSRWSCEQLETEIRNMERGRMINPLSIPYANRNIARARNKMIEKDCPGYENEEIVETENGDDVVSEKQTKMP